MQVKVLDGLETPAILLLVFAVKNFNAYFLILLTSYWLGTAGNTSSIKIKLPLVTISTITGTIITTIALLAVTITEIVLRFS